jgi:hypothetical protein
MLAVTKLLPAQLEEALRELAALGLVTSDGFAAVRSLVPKHKQPLMGHSKRLAAEQVAEHHAIALDEQACPGFRSFFAINFYRERGKL